MEAQQAFPGSSVKAGVKIISWFYRQRHGPFAGFAKPDLPPRDDLLTTWRTSSKGGHRSGTPTRKKQHLHPCLMKLGMHDWAPTRRKSSPLSTVYSVNYDVATSSFDWVSAISSLSCHKFRTQYFYAIYRIWTMSR